MFIIIKFLIECINGWIKGKYRWWSLFSFFFLDNKYDICILFKWLFNFERIDFYLFNICVAHNVMYPRCIFKNNRQKKNWYNQKLNNNKWTKTKLCRNNNRQTWSCLVFTHPTRWMEIVFTAKNLVFYSVCWTSVWTTGFVAVSSPFIFFYF